jgi:hypothetical protein
MLEPRETHSEFVLLCFINKSIYDAYYVYLKLYDRVICAHLYKPVPSWHFKQKKESLNPQRDAKEITSCTRRLSKMATNEIALWIMSIFPYLNYALFRFVSKEGVRLENRGEKT